MEGIFVITALRTLAAIVVGMVVAFVLVIAVEMFGNVFHPLPKDFGGTMEEMCLHVERFPQWVLAVVVALWSGTAFVSTRMAKKIGNVYSFAVVGLLLVAGLALNISKLPYPLWFKIATLVAIPAAILAAGRLARRRKAATPVESKLE
jgi:hypothetical protein